MVKDRALEKWPVFGPLKETQNMKIFDLYVNICERKHTLSTEETVTSQINIVTWPVDITQTAS